MRDKYLNSDSIPLVLGLLASTIDEDNPLRSTFELLKALFLQFETMVEDGYTPVGAIKELDAWWNYLQSKADFLHKNGWLRYIKKARPKAYDIYVKLEVEMEQEKDTKELKTKEERIKEKRKSTRAGKDKQTLK